MQDYQTKARDVYEYFFGNANNDSQNREKTTKVPDSKNTNVVQPKKPFSANKVWLLRFRKRYGSKNTKLIGKATSDKIIATNTSLTENSKLHILTKD